MKRMVIFTARSGNKYQIFIRVTHCDQIEYFVKWQKEWFCIHYWSYVKQAPDYVFRVPFTSYEECYEFINRIENTKIFKSCT